MEPVSGAIAEVGAKSAGPMAENVTQVVAPTAEATTGLLNAVPDVNPNIAPPSTPDTNIIQGLEEKVANLQTNAPAEAKTGEQGQESKPTIETAVSSQTAEQGISDEIKKDPLYQQKLGEAMLQAQKNGEPLDPQKLSQEALANYKSEKEAPKPEDTASIEVRLNKLQDELSVIKLENGLLKTELANLNTTIKEILPAIKALLEDAQAKETEPKKKETLAQLLIKILGMIAASTIMEAGKVVAPPLGQQSG